MNTTIRNLDKKIFRELRAQAVLQGKTIGELLSEAIKTYLALHQPLKKTRSIFELKPVPFPPGNERLSEEIDEIVYGVK